MKTTYDGSIAEVTSAVQMSNTLLTNPLFYEAIRKHASFDMSDASPAVVADLMQESKLEFLVKTFYPRGIQALRYRNTFAYTDANFPDTLFLNEKKLDREVEDIAATIIHEGIHALDDAQEHYSFGHGGNGSAGKENTAPYWIGNLAYKMLKQDPHAPLLAFDQVEVNSPA